MIDEADLRREQHYVLLLSVVLAFTMSVAFFFAPVIMAASYTYTGLLLGFIATVYGWFTANFVYDLDHVTKNHHAGIWVTSLVGTLLGFFVLQRRIALTDWYELLPPSQHGYLISLGFATVYCASYTGFLLYKEETDRL